MSGQMKWSHRPQIYPERRTGPPPGPRHVPNIRTRPLTTPTTQTEAARQPVKAHLGRIIVQGANPPESPSGRSQMYSLLPGRGSKQGDFDIPDWITVLQRVGSLALVHA